jgi:hypothetical protein
MRGLPWPAETRDWRASSAVIDDAAPQSVIRQFSRLFLGRRTGRVGATLGMASHFVETPRNARDPRWATHAPTARVSLEHSIAIALKKEHQQRIRAVGLYTSDDLVSFEVTLELFEHRVGMGDGTVWEKHLLNLLRAIESFFKQWTSPGLTDI